MQRPYNNASHHHITNRKYFHGLQMICKIFQPITYDSGQMVAAHHVAQEHLTRMPNAQKVPDGSQCSQRTISVGAQEYQKKYKLQFKHITNFTTVTRINTII